LPVIGTAQSTVKQAAVMLLWHQQQIIGYARCRLHAKHRDSHLMVACINLWACMPLQTLGIPLVHASAEVLPCFASVSNRQLDMQKGSRWCRAIHHIYHQALLSSMGHHCKSSDLQYSCSTACNMLILKGNQS